MAEAGKTFIWATGRRKTSVARVRMAEGTGKILVNGRPFESYFPVEQQRNDAGAPLAAANAREKWDIWVNVLGGGPTGQSGAVSLGLARALLKSDAALDEPLRGGGFLTRDSRMVERKKYGQRKARRRFQFSKR
ncbi:MAG TPA: 30S ribosomal protein S9 [Planctomycetota bacterium]|jgi:small subunit ribosomal protein S9|nr:30S ribosomal protein S9 [Planctomycetota bacterium]